MTCAMTCATTKGWLRSCVSLTVVIASLVLGCSKTPAPAPEAATRRGRSPAVGTASPPIAPFKVPGNAFIDGRDRKARPPLTVMRVNIWEAVPPRRVACRVPHGANVKLLREQYVSSEERFYFLVDGGRCKGWLADTSLSAKRNPIIGDKR